MQIPTLEEVKNYQGQIGKVEVERLAWLASQVPDNGLIVEIGAFRGKSGASLAFGMPATARLMSIDPWLQLRTPTGREYETIETVKQYSDNLRPWNPRVIQVIAYPPEARKFINQPIDLLFVDAVKKYPGINNIWKEWLPLVKSGGWVATHDYQPNPDKEQYYEGVIKTIEELVKPVTTNHHHVNYTWSGRIE